MNIRLSMMMSIFITALVAGGCATTEDRGEVSSPSMKEMSSTKDTSADKMREGTSPAAAGNAGTSQGMAKESAPSAMTGTAGSTNSRVGVSKDPLQACLNAVSKGASPGQRAIAEQTCQRDFGTGDPRAVASGTQGDTYQNCLARIPKDASPGQRMIAEGSCQRDEEVRRGF